MGESEEDFTQKIIDIIDEHVDYDYYGSMDSVYIVGMRAAGESIVQFLKERGLIP